MRHGFVHLAVGVPEVSVACPEKNAESIIDVIENAFVNGAHVLVLPELCVSAYTCGDLFLTDSLIRRSEEAVAKIVRETTESKILTFIGAPVRVNDKLYNCAIAIISGKILGITPKQNIPGYSEFYETRHFTPGTPDVNGEISYAGQTVPFGTDLIYTCNDNPYLRVGAEICEDLWVADSPSNRLAAMGATVIANLSASNETVGKDEYRKTLVKAASGKQISAYIYADAGSGESTTDLVFSGHSMIACNGEIIAERQPFAEDPFYHEFTITLCDLQHLCHDRNRINTAKSVTGARKIPFSLEGRICDILGEINPHPFVPKDQWGKKSTYASILDIQSTGLAKRIRASHSNGCVVALSGGLDSTLALLVAANAIDLLHMDRKCITTVTMPCFGTTSRTRSNAEKMAQALGTSFRCIDIKEAVDLHFRDINHNPEDLSVVYENSQARERTQIIMDIANAEGSLVVGTGDLSELALGWATYNGDHMSNYGVNAGVPKTLVRHIVSYCADKAEEYGEEELAETLRDVLATPVSPELLPAKDGEIAQKTEDIVGPYDLHDFFLYHFVRWGEESDKILREAEAAFDKVYDEETIKKWLNIFMRRFYTQQFKRSALPDGPKVGSAALSPRGDWRMPSDADPSGIGL